MYRQMNSACVFAICPFVLLVMVGEVYAARWSVVPGQNPQDVVDTASAGDWVVLEPGLHEHGLSRDRAIISVEKPLTIELAKGATLRLAGGTCKLDSQGELTIDHGVKNQRNDLEFGGTFDVSAGPRLYTVRIDSQGVVGVADTFSWGDTGVFQYVETGVPITGDLQTLSNGVDVRFGTKSGHQVGSLWFASYDGPEAYGIRIGTGTHVEPIENVTITGTGTIDMNRDRNVLPSGMVADINACVLIHGRVRKVLVEEITMQNTMRSVMVYGEHTGDFLPGGAVGIGESFDAEDIDIVRTRTINPNGAAYLLGHPSHRGHLRRVRCNFNQMVTGKTAIEPNFQLDHYEVIGNVIDSAGEAIHCWRKSTRGIIRDNLRVNDTSGRPVVRANSPGAWDDPAQLTIKNNRNLLSDPASLGKLE